MPLDTPGWWPWEAFWRETEEESHHLRKIEIVLKGVPGSFITFKNSIVRTKKERIFHTTWWRGARREGENRNCGWDKRKQTNKNK